MNRKPTTRPLLAPVVEVASILAALAPSAPARRTIPGRYAEDACKVCKAPAGTALPCAFCPKPIIEAPVKGRSLE